MKAVLLLLSLVLAQGFYLPGVAPRDWQLEEKVELKVNKLDSVKTQLPYDFYSLPFCRPDNVVEAAENLGEILSGDMIESSAYEIFMKKSEKCKLLCKQEYTPAQLVQLEEKIKEYYVVHWIVDNIPAATVFLLEEIDDQGQPTGNSDTVYEKGFPLGYVDQESKKAYINNHVRLVLSYHEDAASFNGFRIVGFQVQAFSLKHGAKIAEACAVDPTTAESACVDPGCSGSITYTYDVEWQASPIKWASRWDLYLKMTNSEIHWFSIINSIMMVLFLSGVVAMILMRTLRRDLEKYNSLAESGGDDADETGWKLIHGEVFRPPVNPGFFAVLVGAGAQVFSMCVLTLIFACLGFLSPANRGGLMTAFLLLFVFMGMLAGYFSTRVYTMFKLTEWKRNTLHTALFFPGVMFSIFFVLNLFVWGQKSSGAVPFGTLIALLVLWFGISVPLVYLGSYFAAKKDPIEHPVRINQIPRMLPADMPWYGNRFLGIMAGGTLPFGAVFIEIFFIMSSIWQHQFYYVFGILGIVFLILILMVTEMSIVLCYFQLCLEDYHWWWRSYLGSGSAALYLFLYSIVYFFTQLEIIKFVSGLLFFGYMLLVSFAFFVLCGSVGYFSCFFFVRKIYSSIKID